MWRKFCGWILRVWGWEKSTFLPPEPKCILLGVPHTSMLDFVVAYLFYVSIGGKTFCMVKSSLFFPPTRKPVSRWKTGYHFIAKAANIPVYLCYFDWGRKRIAVDQKFELTDDANADTRRIQEIYESMNLKGRHPEKYLTK